MWPRSDELLETLRQAITGARIRRKYSTTYGSCNLFRDFDLLAELAKR